MSLRLETPRLALREMGAADLDFVASMLADPEVMRFYPSTMDRAAAAAWIEMNRGRYADRGFGRWIVEERATGRPVGQVGLIVLDVGGADEVEVAYMIDRAYWRRGYAAEAAARSVDHGLATLGLGRVVALIRPINVASLGVAEKIGLTTDGRTVPHAGMTHLVYSIARPDR